MFLSPFNICVTVSSFYSVFDPDTDPSRAENMQGKLRFVLTMYVKMIIIKQV